MSPACQTSGLRTWECPACEHLNQHRSRPGSYRVQCRGEFCRRHYVLGTIFYEVLGSPTPSIPCDLAIPGHLASTDRQPPICTLCGADLPSERTSREPERAMLGGVWRSGQPINIVIPEDWSTAKLWQDKELGDIYMAMSAAMGTRYIGRNIFTNVLLVLGRKEWKERMMECLSEEE